MAYGKKKNYGCLKAFLFAWFVLAVGGYTFYRLAPKTAQNAKKEAFERIFGKDSVAVDTVKVDTIANVGKIIPEYVKPDEDVVSIPIEVDSLSCHLTCEVNGVDVRFMLDTGCSGIQITSAEYYYMLNMGAIKKQNLGNDYAVCTYADGSQDSCMVVNIDSIKVGDIVVRNVTATIAKNAEAPRLLGQAVLQKLGNVSFDYRKKKLNIRKDV